MPEVFQIRPVENTGGSSLNSQLIYDLRKDYMNGFSKDDLIKKYNITKPNLNRILKLDRWNKENAIPSGYKEFISN